MKKKIILISILSLIVILISTLFMPFSFTPKNKEYSFENVMKDALSSTNPKVTEVAMLGAHDAYSSNINMKSKPNVNEGGIVNNSIVNAIGKGLVVRMSRAQKASAKELLMAGVRYFDARISYIDGVYYTIHGYVSNTLDEVLLETAEFIEEHPSEFIIFDIQHFYIEDRNGYDITKEEFQALFTYIESVKTAEGNSLISFVNYDSTVDNLSNLTYQKVTKNEEKGGVIFTIKNSEITLAYDRGGDVVSDNTKAVRSLWHQDNSSKRMLAMINEEKDYIMENYDVLKDIFRVNQAQKTGFIMSSKLLRSLFSFSILDMANNFNKELISDKELMKEWLYAMPILMVDYANSSKGNFNEEINEFIIEYNKGL